jgi:ribosomal protein L40E
MSGGQGITKELSLSEVVSMTFRLYQRDFLKYVILFAVVEAIIGVFTTLVQRAITLPTLPAHATTQQFLNWAPGFFGALFSLIALIAIVTLVFFPVAVGSAVKIASEQIERERADLEASIRFAMSKSIQIWAVSIVVGIIVSLGLIALVVPGIILAMMFSLVLPVVMIESLGVLESLGRSRKLVSSRWLKTLALAIVFGIITGIASAIVRDISGPFGIASTVVSSVLSAFYLPVVPIALTVYYYSNAARIAPPQTSQAPVTPASAVQTGMNFCPDCGTQLASTATFCSKCGAKQPA